MAAAVLVAAVLMLRHRMSLPTNTVCLTLEQDVGRGYQGHWVGMSMVYVDGKGALHCNNIPSLQGLWQLDEAYAVCVRLLRGGKAPPAAPQCDDLSL